MKVKAIATRSGLWWAIEADVAGGLHTQARRLEQIPSVVADAVALVMEVPAEEVEVQFDVVLPGSDADLVEHARATADRAAEAAQEASVARRTVVRVLRDHGLTVRDTGELLGVSPQRVSQLLEA